MPSSFVAPNRLTLRRITLGVLVGALLFTGAAIFGRVRDQSPNSVTVADRPAGAVVTSAAGANLESQIAALTARVTRVPSDSTAWAYLALAYVQQARITADPKLYEAADAALAKSERTQPHDNFLASLGRAAVAAARHDFASAKRWAEQGLKINPENPLLYGALADAEVQLGNYGAAYRAIQIMVDLRPDTSSLARVSYSWELRGRIDRAQHYMQRALEDAPTKADRAFARYYLAQLAYDNGDAKSALGHVTAGLVADPDYVPLYEARAKVKYALGDIDGALQDYAIATDRQPQPAWLLEYGELAQSLNKLDSARQQYELFEATQQLFAQNKVLPDVDAVLYEADHGNPKKAVRLGEKAVQRRPFYEMQDALAWALYKAGDYREALIWSERARALGTRKALVLFHAGMIEKALGNENEAKKLLADALTLNPHFHPLYAPIARVAVQESQGQ